jgi:hypothetical protein
LRALIIFVISLGRAGLIKIHGRIIIRFLCFIIIEGSFWGAHSNFLLLLQKVKASFFSPLTDNSREGSSDVLDARADVEFHILKETILVCPQNFCNFSI